MDEDYQRELRDEVVHLFCVDMCEPDSLARARNLLACCLDTVEGF